MNKNSPSRPVFSLHFKCVSVTPKCFGKWIKKKDEEKNTLKREKKNHYFVIYVSAHISFNLFLSLYLSLSFSHTTFFFFFIVYILMCVEVIGNRFHKKNILLWFEKKKVWLYMHMNGGNMVTIFGALCFIILKFLVFLL